MNDERRFSKMLNPNPTEMSFKISRILDLQIFVGIRRHSNLDLNSVTSLTENSWEYVLSDMVTVHSSRVPTNLENLELSGNFCKPGKVREFEIWSRYFFMTCHMVRDLLTDELIFACNV